MAEIKLVLTDIDGTIVMPGQQNPTLEVQEAIRDVQQAGIELTAATGRPYEMMEPLFTHLGFKDLGIFDAGASIRQIETGELVWSNWLDAERVHAIASIILPHATIIDFYPYYKEVKASEADITTATDAPYVFAFVNNNAKTKVEDRLQEVPDISYHIGPSRDDCPGVFDIQITDIKSDKNHAVTALRSLVYSSKAETLAIGDSSNDLPLFENAGIKVAMGNASDALKSKADYVVSDVQHNGFAEAMRQFVLR